MTNNAVFVTAVSFHPHRALRGASSRAARFTTGFFVSSSKLRVFVLKVCHFGIAVASATQAGGSGSPRPGMPFVFDQR